LVVVKKNILVVMVAREVIRMYCPLGYDFMAAVKCASIQLL
jgi:hypothetical protein